MKFAIGVLLLFLLVGCQAPKPDKPSSLPAVRPPEKLELRSRTIVRIALLDRLESGVTKRGYPIRFVVVRAVEDDEGQVIIPRGTIGTASVAWSRRGTTVASLVNQPARLAIRFDPINFADGTRVTLATKQRSGDLTIAGYELTGENTVQVQPNEALAVDLPPSEREAIELFEELGIRAFEDPATKAALREVSQRANLKIAGPALEGDVAKSLQGTAQKFGDHTLRHLAPNELDVLLELSGFTDFAVDRVSKMLKARQVVAPIGCEITAYVMGDYRIDPAAIPDLKEGR